MSQTPTTAGKDTPLYFLPLGGTGEIGMNLNLYALGDQWLMVDLGVTFAREGLPGVEVLMPDPAFIEERADKLTGLVLTHAHEDHIGAVPYLWERLRCPIYATPFTAELVRAKLIEAGLESEAKIHEVPLSGRFTVGPFEIELITLTHSIPEPNAVVIRCSAGTLLHTGDWKLDPEPVIGDNYDEAALKRLADESVVAMICDSTNALVDGDSGSEGQVRESLAEIVADLKGKVAVACFASNVARLESVIRAAEQNGRRVVLAGRSMHRIVEAAQRTGYLKNIPPFLNEEDVGYLPPEEVLILCTGSQGEPRAALWRIARNANPNITLGEGDAVIFSSRIIPGNETSIFELQNELVRKGIEVIDDDVEMTHVSGHPARDELAQMYQWVRPRVAIPVHGEARHLKEHAELALECQVPQAILAENGSLIRLAPGRPEIVDKVDTGRLALDGNRLLALDSPVLRQRRKIMHSGIASVVLVVDRQGELVTEPRLALTGVIDEELEGDLAEDCLDAIEESLRSLPRGARRDDGRLSEAAAVAVRRVLNRAIGKKPVAEVEVVRLD